MINTLDTPQIALPFEILPNGRVDEVEQDTLDEIAMSIESILRYPLDYRVDLPDFGTPELTFHLDPAEVSRIILDHVSRWEERAPLLIENRPDEWDELIQNYIVTAGGTT
jgi:phage baseplate assembly protein W